MRSAHAHTLQSYGTFSRSDPRKVPGPTCAAQRMFPGNEACLGRQHPPQETNRDQPPAAVLMIFTLVLMVFLWLMSSIFS